MTTLISDNTCRGVFYLPGNIIVLTTFRNNLSNRLVGKYIFHFQLFSFFLSLTEQIFRHYRPALMESCIMSLFLHKIDNRKSLHRHYTLH